MNNILDILKQYWGYDSFRDPQDQIISAVLNKNDVLALMPTGGGKSICFQVPTMAMKGCCLVVSPLIALMKDQVHNLVTRNISATYIDSSMSSKESNLILENAQLKMYKFLYVSPERLQSENFLARLKHIPISLVAIDEAHCISQWGYDFRPSYLKIIEIRKYLKPDVPFIALTASATPEVQDDIVDKLGLKNVQKFSLSYERKNISYSCIEVEDKLSKTLKILQKINGSAIVYTRNRLKTVEIAKYLLANKISADYYHAGLPYRDREQKQERWTAGHIRVMVATNAFGMGIDKPDVRVVIHVDLPDSLEAYYQEAGRAGRDTQKAYATILYQPGDIEELLARPLEYQFYESQLKYTYQALANYYKVAAGDVENSFDFNIEDFCKVFNLKVIDTYKNIKQLSYLGLLELNEAFYSSPLLYVPSQTDLYRYQVENKKFEPIIKNILRLYGGEIFAVPTKISEKKIAQLSNVSEENIIKFLTYLDKLTIVHYSPKRDKPLLTFVGHRQDVKTLKIDKVKNNWRKEILTIKVNALKDYILNKACRTKMILAYFGENDYQQCNNCDYCVNKNREDLANYYPKAKEIILELLKHNALDMKSISLNLSTFNTMAYQYAIQKMLDQNILTYNEKGQLTIKS